MKYILGLFLTLTTSMLYAQSCVLPVTLNQLVNNSTLIVEGRVVGQTAQWDANHQMIHTISEVEVFKVFKGNTNTTRVFIENHGGIIGLDRIVVEPELELSAGDYGIFTLKSSTSNVAFLTPLFMSAEGPQGFIAYSPNLTKASGLFNTYHDIESELYTPIQQLTGQTYVQKKKLSKTVPAKAVSASGNISNFSPATITSGTASVLTINGTGFGATQGSSFVGFANADNGGSNYISPIASEYISWSNTQIQVEVPSDAGTGSIIVSDGTNTLTSSSDLTVTYAIINVSSSGNTYQANHVNDNGNGGYSFLAHTDFNNNTAAMADFNWALDEWRCNTDINWSTTGTTTVDDATGDGFNVVRFDNGSELPGSVLGVCYSYYSGCSVSGNIEWYVTELDVVFNDDYAATWHYGGGPIGTNNYDFRSVALHEMGHGHQLGHVINSNQVMHWALSNGQQNTSIAPGELAGGQYQMNLSFNDARCSQTVMTPNGCNSTPVANFTVDGPAICAANGLTVAFTNTSTFSPTSYAWDIDGDDVTDYTTADVNHTYSTAGLYNIRMIATNSVGSDTAFTTIYVGAGDPATVCTPTTTNAGNFDAGIVRVEFGDIDFTSNATGSTGSPNQGYFDFACPENTILNAGQTYPFEITLGDFNAPKCKIWIDFDNNGTFNNTSELVYNGTNNSATHTGNITIASSAVQGTVLRMRVVSDLNTINGACNNVEYGEINDYGVFVSCSGPPVADQTTLPTITGQCSATVTATPTASEPCSSTTITGTTNDPTSYSAQGTYTITWSFAGANGTSTQTQTVVVDDSEAPEVDFCPGTITENTNAANCSANVSWTAATATDNCSSVTTSATHTPGDLFPQGVTTVTYTFTDAENNQSTCAFDVIVVSDLSVSATTTDELSGNDGTIDAEVTGGTAPYTYDWDTDGTGDFDDPQDLNNLAGGTYTLVVQDDESCQDTLEVTVDSQLGLQNEAAIRFQLFPNPANDELNIQLLNGQDQAWTYRLLDLNGKTLCSEERTSDSAVVNLSALAQGVYVVQVTIDQTEQTIRIVKE